MKGHDGGIDLRGGCGARIREGYRQRAEQDPPLRKVKGENRKAKPGLRLGGPAPTTEKPIAAVEPDNVNVHLCRRIQDDGEKSLRAKRVRAAKLVDFGLLAREARLILLRSLGRVRGTLQFRCGTVRCSDIASTWLVERGLCADI